MHRDKHVVFEICKRQVCRQREIKTGHTCLSGAYENAGAWNNQVWKNQVRLCRDGKCNYRKMRYD